MSEEPPAAPSAPVDPIKPSVSPRVKLSQVTNLLMSKGDRSSVSTPQMLSRAPSLGGNSLIRKFQGMGEEKAVLTDSELRKLIFRQDRPRNIVDSLRVAPFTRQAFTNSFLFGLAVGSCAAILLKLMVEFVEWLI